MRKNLLPAVLAFAPTLLLPLVQDFIRPRVFHGSALGFVLSWAPDFIVGFCFPFSILIRPRAWSEQTAIKLFNLWAAFTVIAIFADEFMSPFGPNVFDPADLAAGVGGTAIAVLIFHSLLRRQLMFGADSAMHGTGDLARERSAV